MKTWSLFVKPFKEQRKLSFLLCRSMTLLISAIQKSMLLLLIEKCNEFELRILYFCSVEIGTFVYCRCKSYFGTGKPYCYKTLILVCILYVNKKYL